MDNILVLKTLLIHSMIFQSFLVRKTVHLIFWIFSDDEIIEKSQTNNAVTYLSGDIVKKLSGDNLRQKYSIF